MASGILPTCIHKGKIYFLFGKENKFADTPGWSDFGGGRDNQETYLQTAIREGGEELTGFLGSDKQLGSMLRRGCVKIMNNGYRIHVFDYPYDEMLVHYYNNNQRFIQYHLDENVIKSTKIFEKSEIRWICEDELERMKKDFRPYFVPVLGMLQEQRVQILNILKRGRKSSTRKR